MFFELDETIVDYSPKSEFNITGIYHPVNTTKTLAQDILMSSFMIVRNNCEEACSQKLLSELSDNQKEEYRNNSKITQHHLKTIDDSTSRGFESCIRRCFSINN
jgi:hypothetical protein